MSQSSDSGPLGAEAPVRVRFSTADTTSGDHLYLPEGTRPSVLLLTQNVGGIEAQSDLASSVESSFGLTSPTTGMTGPSAFLPAPEVVAVSDLLRSPPELADLPPPQLQATNVFTAVHANTGTATTTTGPPPPPLGLNLLPQECSPSATVSAATVSHQVTRWLREFVTELRLWLHRAAFHYATRHSHANAERSAEYSPDAIVPMIDVVVIHFQEIGGKYRHTAFNDALERLLVQYLLPEAGWNSGLLMERDPSQFSAMGSIIFLSPRVCPVASILSIPQRSYIPIMDDPRTYGDSARYLYHHAKFASAGKSRKGFLLFSLRIGTVVLNICNLHNFHDVDNRLAVETSPSCYATRRLTSVLEAVAECFSVVSPEEPFFLMGDFNTRLDGMHFVSYLRDQLQIEVQAGSKELRCPDLAWELFGKAADGSGGSGGNAPRLQPLGSHSTSSNLLYQQQMMRSANKDATSGGGASSDDAEVSGAERDEERLQQLDTLDELQERFDVEMDGIIESVAANFNVLLAEFPKQFAPTYSRLPRRALLSSLVEVASDSLLAFVEGTSPTSGDTSSEPTFSQHRRHASYGVEAGAPTHKDRRAAAVPPLLNDVARSHPFVHERFPAWCDRILFNPTAFESTVAGLGRTFSIDEEDGTTKQTGTKKKKEEEIAEEEDPKKRKTTVEEEEREGEEEEREADEEKGPANTYLYNSCSLIHTDHDGVFLLF